MGNSASNQAKNGCPVGQIKVTKPPPSVQLSPEEQAIWKGVTDYKCFKCPSNTASPGGNEAVCQTCLGNTIAYNNNPHCTPCGELMENSIPAFTTKNEYEMLHSKPNYCVCPPNYTQVSTMTWKGVVTKCAPMKSQGQGSSQGNSISPFTNYGDGDAPNRLTDAIPNWAICDWYYFLFILNAVAFVVVIIAFLTARKKVIMKSHMLVYVISGIFSATNALFYYLVCDRALKPM